MLNSQIEEKKNTFTFQMILFLRAQELNCFHVACKCRCGLPYNETKN